MWTAPVELRSRARHRPAKHLDEVDDPSIGHAIPARDAERSPHGSVQTLDLSQQSWDHRAHRAAVVRFFFGAL